jgi:pimeloyl-ACP methyl ester carboxylesterase
MESAFLLIGDSRLHYTVFGTGSRLLLCFHGYGESAGSFAFLNELLTREFTVVAIDMPFHGGTQWRGEASLEPMDLLAALERLINGFPRLQKGWWLLGYSMGGRVALQLLELAPEKIRRVVLLAPDGLHVNAWYWLSTQTLAGNYVFRRTMTRPAWLFLLLRAGNRLKLVNPSLFKFTSHYIDNEEARQQLYARWMAMRAFSPGLPAIARLVRDHKIPVELLYGSFDRIIRWERGERFRRSCTPYCRLTVLTAGHQLLQPKFAEVIVNALYLPIV